MNSHLAEIETRAVGLLHYHGLLQQGWGVGWIRAKNTAGRCVYDENMIYLSTTLMDLWTVERAEQTILHEIAHALTKGDHHGDRWKQKCIELGIEPRRCWNPKMEATPPSLWVGTCGEHRHERNRLSEDDRHMPCCNCRQPISWRKRQTA